MVAHYFLQPARPLPPTPPVCPLLCRLLRAVVSPPYLHALQGHADKLRHGDAHGTELSVDGTAVLVHQLPQRRTDSPSCRSI